MRLQEYYKSEVAPALVKQFGYKSNMQIPRLLKVTLNMGLGDAVNDKKVVEHAVSDLTLIAGQKAVVTLAHKSIAGFKIRDGMAVGCRVTLHGKRMYDFMERLINIAIPRIRDFRGLNEKSFDGRGNYNFGIKEQIIFTEIDYDKVDKVRGLDVAITTSARTDEEARAFLKAINLPIRG